MVKGSLSKDVEILISDLISSCSVIDRPKYKIRTILLF